jgi:hypothetical protein
MVVAPSTDGHQSIFGDHHLRRYTLASWQNVARMNYRMREQPLKMRVLTMVLPRWLTALMVGGDELNITDTEDELRKGNIKFASLSAPLNTIFLLDVLLDMVHLLDPSTAAGWL